MIQAQSAAPPLKHATWSQDSHYLATVGMGENDYRPSIITLFRVEEQGKKLIKCGSIQVSDW